MADTNYTPRMRKLYDEVVRQKILEEFGYKNAMEVPRIDKVVLNMGVGESTADSKKAQRAADDLTPYCRSEGSGNPRPQFDCRLQGA